MDNKNRLACAVKCGIDLGLSKVGLTSKKRVNKKGFGILMLIKAHKFQILF